MRALDLENAFLRYLGNHGRTLDNLDATTAIGSMIMFYAHHRVTDVDIDDDGDMLLFQWGTYGSDGFGLIRQLERIWLIGNREPVRKDWLAISRSAGRRHAESQWPRSVRPTPDASSLTTWSRRVEVGT
ncbi:hypothetical protein [Nocardia lijiangensis]|uniref:hypothetical protein n=1 Tax=Nocardia lijiangensis TaxID=299618 RepID=UPI00082A7149|nr:hypothetical protein [Nocardia lijiangensis]